MKELDYDSENQALIDFAKETLGIEHRISWEAEGADEPIPVVMDRNGTVRVFSELMQALEERRHTPMRRQGVAYHDEMGSFVTHVNRFKSEHSTIWACQQDVKLVAILDYHPAGPSGAGWLRHRSVYQCPRSPEWVTWTAHDNKAMSQDDFADFLEAHLENLTSDGDYPKPLDMLEVARNLHVFTRGTFQRVVNPTTGDYTMICKSETSQDSTKIPRAFLLALRVFEGGAAYRVEARVRFSVREGRPVFAYQLYRREEIERDAFDDVREEAADRTGLTVFAGQPER